MRGNRPNPDGNERLTATIGALLLIPILVELATIPLGVHTFMSLHVFVGLLLIPAVVLKLASTGWRFARYYSRSAAYRALGPPQTAMRLLAPFLVVATVVLLGSGVAMGFLHGSALGWARRLHGPASVVWIVLVGLHVLVYLRRTFTKASEDADPAKRSVAPGAGRRAYVVVAALLAGLALGAATVPAQHRWIDLRRHHDHGDRRDDLGASAPGRTLLAASAAAVRVYTLRFVDHSRTIRLPDGRTVARPLTTIVRRPASGSPHPLLVFAHGFERTPADYASLLRAIASAGYVVAAPVFPLTSTRAPGGPNEADLVNQPADVRFVITRLLALNRSRGRLHDAIDPLRIAVAGQSDGGITALSVAYDARYRDPRVRAAIVMSGALPAGFGSFPADGPPLLALQGTADTLNSPATTAAYFALAHRPKFLVWLLGASHLPPYTDEQPQLGIVERSAIAFLGHYFDGRPLAALERAARRPGVTRLVSDP
jgi:dienelactone hydrolase